MNAEHCPLFHFNGLKIVTSLNMTKPGKPYDVERSFKERFFTFPWRPFKATRRVVPQIPSDEILKTKDDELIMHPETFEKLYRAAKAETQTFDPTAYRRIYTNGFRL